LVNQIIVVQHTLKKNREGREKKDVKKPPQISKVSGGIFFVNYCVLY